MKNILDFFGKVQDKGKKRGKRYKLKSILGLILLGYMRGCKSLAQIHRFTKSLRAREKRKLGFDKNVPSHPTLTETIKLVDPLEFEEAIRKIILLGPEFEHIAIDGKSVRSTCHTAKGLLHLVSAYSVETCGVLAQMKSVLVGGEIQSAENIVSRIDIKGKIITGDAMFTQHSLCNKIVDADGNYLFKVKKNKKYMLHDICQKLHYYETKSLPISFFESTAEKGHGRIEQRLIEVIDL
jgi:predicted transposase YbfD/YdcC